MRVVSFCFLERLPDYGVTVYIIWRQDNFSLVSLCVFPNIRCCIVRRRPKAGDGHGKAGDIDVLGQENPARLLDSYRPIRQEKFAFASEFG